MEDVISNLLKDINKDKISSESKKQQKRLEVIRYLCDEMSQRRAQGSICKLFGYISQVYESQISQLQLSKIEALTSENKKLLDVIDQEREQKVKIEKDLKSQISELKKHNQSAINKLEIQIEELKKSDGVNKTKEKSKKHQESEESDIFEGLNSEKRERIMSEVAELYEANVALQMENKILKDNQQKLENGLKFMDTKGEFGDSMNVDSEYEDEGSFVKNGSYTDNSQLGKSHDQDTLGSIHNIFVDPTSESFIQERKKELAYRKPNFVPELDFDKLRKPDLIEAIKLKAFGVNKNILKPSHSQKIHMSHSNRVPGEKISFSMEHEGDESASETIGGGSNSFSGEELKHSHLKSSHHHNHSHIMIKDSHNVSSNLNDESQNYGSNISKMQNSCFASSSEATKK